MIISSSQRFVVTGFFYGKGAFMEFQKLVDSFYAPTCIMSVEKTEDGRHGEIRMVAGNKKYKDMIDIRVKQEAGVDELEGGTAFVPDTIYSEYFPENRSFENVCFRAAVQKTEIHTYAYLNQVDIWFDIYVIPIDYEEGNICYCAYMAIPTHNAELILDTVNSNQMSNEVLKTCIKLHKADNLKEAMESVISDIRKICNAETCTVLLLDEENESYSILATDFNPGSTVRSVTTFSNFYNIALSWKKMIGDEGDCIIIKDKADMENVSRVNNSWYQTLVDAGVDSCVLFPLRHRNKVLGFVWAVNFDTEKTLRIKENLELTTFFISSHIAGYQVVKRLEHMSYTDALTGLPNRFACVDYISDLIKKNKKFAAVSINLNHFKSVNETFGFEVGNHVLIEVGNRWKALIDNEQEENADYITRTNGDEFLLVIKDYSSDEELEKRINKYVDALTEQFTVDGSDMYIRASFGYVEYPKDADSADAIISDATAAMNEIKKANSSEHILRYTPDLLQNEHVLKIENLIRTALENDTIYFNLQPQYDMNHKLRGFEALARMKDSDGNNISPGEFIPVAEKVGLIDRVDGAVFRKATAFFGELLKKSGADMMLSINASVRHLMKRDFIDEIKSLLETSGIPAEKLEIEITESIMIDSVDKAQKCIDEIKDIGIKIAIDDFGTGYSSLGYLNKFPANLLKIDKSFIDKMNSGESSRQYVAAIISIGHIMGFDVISEGVEEQDQLETLGEIGCDYIQGFIWGRPLSAEDAEKLVMDIPACK
jgi:diguanylate cyclase (GGDEF)-like protein